MDQIFDTIDATRDVQYATAPDLATSTPTPLRLDWYQPAGDDLAARPAIVWVHGGGFTTGSKENLSDLAQAYARRGYVTLSIDYRLNAQNPCLGLRDTSLTAEQRAAMAAQCSEAMLAAQHDTQAAIRWLRANAAALRVDPTRVAVGGSSAGAMTAVHVAQRSDDPGDVGDHDEQPSGVSLGLAASGCNAYQSSIDSTDAPIFLLASELDALVGFACVQNTETRTRAVGGTVETLYYMGENTHARSLYYKYQAAVDAVWTAFLVTHLDLP